MIASVESHAREEFATVVARRYLEATGIRANIYLVAPAEGARSLYSV